MVGDTKLIVKCSRCDEEKERCEFIKKRNICKNCDNTRNRDKYKNFNSELIIDKTCSCCKNTKPVSEFVRCRSLCKECNNNNRREKYKTNEEHRNKLIQMAMAFKQSKIVEKQRIKEETIGKDNKKCRVCEEIKPMDNFRNNRLKCKDCLRDEPFDKFKRSIRARIWIALNKNKENHTIHYLGCDSNSYFKWMLNYNENYTIENRGKEWHIDHVIPLSRFDLENEDEQIIAFNWRNTMPLSVKENLSKNNRIDKTQIEQHYNRLLKYHQENNIELPKEFIDLFAKHLVAGIPLEPVLSNK
jgi:hypothetical protein